MRNKQLKIIFLLGCVLLALLSGCHKSEPLDEMSELLVKMTVKRLDKFGYNKNNTYLLEGPYKEEKYDYPLVYELKVNNLTKYYCLWDYRDEMPIGGFWQKYGEGYIGATLIPVTSPEASGIDTSKMEKGNKTIRLNDYLLFAKDVVIDELPSDSLNDDLLESIIDYTVEYIGYSGLQESYQQGVKIGVIGPLIWFNTAFDDDGILHLKLSSFSQYLVSLNGKVLIHYYVLPGDALQLGQLDPENIYDKMISEEERFVIVNDTTISDSMDYDEDMAPASIRESFYKTKEYLKEMNPYNIVKERTVTEWSMPEDNQ